MTPTAAPHPDPDVAACVAALGEGRAVRLVARGRSMTPAIADGATVEVLPWHGGVPEVGEVVLALVRRDPPEIVLHRVVGREGRLAITAGDAARNVDEEAVAPTRVLGHVPAARWPRRRVATARAARRLRAAWRDALDGAAHRLPAPSDEVAAWCRALGAALRAPGSPESPSADGAPGDAAPPPVPLVPHVPAATSPGAWAFLVRERLGEAVAALAAETDTALPADAAAVIREAAVRALARDATVAALDAVLHRAGLAARTLRGGALARRWPWPDARPSSDVDLVAAPAAVAPVVAALAAAGWALAPREAAAWGDVAARERLLQTANRVHLAPPPGAPFLEVELHWRPLPSDGAMLLFASPEAAARWAASWAPPADGPAGVLDDLPSVADALLLAALHWVKHHARPLREVLDAAVLLRALEDGAAAALAARARDLGAGKALAALAWTARGLFGAPLPPGWPRALAGPAAWAAVRWRFAPARQLARLAARGEAPTRLVTRLADLLVLAGASPRRWWRLAAWFVAPPAAYLAETYGRADRPEGTRAGGPVVRAFHRALHRRRGVGGGGAPRGGGGGGFAS